VTTTTDTSSQKNLGQLPKER